MMMMLVVVVVMIVSMTHAYCSHGLYRITRKKIVRTDWRESTWWASVLQCQNSPPSNLQDWAAVEERFARDHKLKTAIGNRKARLWQCFKKQLGAQANMEGLRSLRVEDDSDIIGSDKHATWHYCFFVWPALAWLPSVADGLLFWLEVTWLGSGWQQYKACSSTFFWPRAYCCCNKVSRWFLDLSWVDAFSGIEGCSEWVGTDDDDDDDDDHSWATITSIYSCHHLYFGMIFFWLLGLMLPNQIVLL